MGGAYRNRDLHICRARHFHFRCLRFCHCFLAAFTNHLGEVEKISQAQEKRLGLRLFYGNSSASASTSDISRQAIDKLLEDTINMARFTAQDPFSGVPEASLLARDIPDMDLFDAAAGSVSVDDKIAIALAAEKAAMEFDPRITNSEGAEFSNQSGRVIYASSHGFCGEYYGSNFGHSVAPIASQNG